MDYRTKLLLYSPACAVLLLTTGCAYNQQTKYHMSFLPPAPASAAGGEISEPPVVQPNLYLQDAPAFTKPNPLPTQKVKADDLMHRAEQRFERGQRAYRSQEYGAARQEFDAAVDLAIEAIDFNPADRPSYERRMDQMVDSIHRYDLGGLGAAAATAEAEFDKAPLEDILQMTFPVDPRLKNRVKEQVAATVSQLPLSVNDAVLGYIHYFSNGGRKTMIAGLQRAGRYRPLIRRILDEEGVPQELIHLAQAESGFFPRAVSRAKAGGMWQFLTWRGQEYGLMQTKYTDDRMDPEKATRAAARHLRDLYTEFGDWYLAIAAYNCGPVTIEKAVERTGYADFWELRSRGVIPAETTNYVPIILAMTIMEKNAAEYGLENITPEQPVEYDSVDTTSVTSLALVSDLTETPASELATLNPAVLRGVAPANYSIRVPKGTGSGLMTALQLVPEDKRAAWRMHHVSGGDTLASIARLYGAAPSAIAAANRLTDASVAEGDRLLIPAVMRETLTRPAPSATANKRAPARRTARASGRAAGKSAVKSVAEKTTPARKHPTVLTHTASR